MIRILAAACVLSLILVPCLSADETWVPFTDDKGRTDLVDVASGGADYPESQFYAIKEIAEAIIKANGGNEELGISASTDPAETFVARRPSRVRSGAVSASATAI